MKRYLFTISILYFFGCNTDPLLNETTITNRSYHGRFQITSINNSNSIYVESGSIQITFSDTIYNYKAYYYDTTFGRGKFFKDGLNDKGNYSKLSNKLIMQDYAVIFGLGTPTGSPSLYLNGQFKISKENHHIILTNKNEYQEYIIELED